MAKGDLPKEKSVEDIVKEELHKAVQDKNFVAETFEELMKDMTKDPAYLANAMLGDIKLFLPSEQETLDQMKREDRCIAELCWALNLIFTRWSRAFSVGTMQTLIAEAVRTVFKVSRAVTQEEIELGILKKSQSQPPF